MKAATSSGMSFPNKCNISIHAAREGGDIDVIQTFKLYCISIHAAREGGDGYVSRKRLGIIISIHAAREGGDF